MPYRATGNNGREIIQQFLSTAVLVRVLVRGPHKDAQQVQTMQAQGVEVVTGDLADPDSLDRALSGVDRALLLSAASPQQVQLQGTIALPLGDGRLSMVDLRDVPVVLAKILTEDGHTGRTYVLTGPRHCPTLR